MVDEQAPADPWYLVELLDELHAAANRVPRRPRPGLQGLQLLKGCARDRSFCRNYPTMVRRAPPP